MANRTHGREHRIADFIQRELSTLLRRELTDPRVKMVTITEVRVTRDLSLARVYVSSLSPDGLFDSQESKTELLEALNGAANYLRGFISRASTMRSTPKLQFLYDETIEQGVRMDRLIREVRERDRNQQEGQQEGDRQ